MNCKKCNLDLSLPFDADQLKTYLVKKGYCPDCGAKL